MTNFSKTLPKDVFGKIKQYHCPKVHPTAQLIKELQVNRNEEGDEFAGGYPSVCVYGRAIQSRGRNRPRFRRYLLTDFMEPDLYVQHSKIYIVDLF